MTNDQIRQLVKLHGPEKAMGIYRNHMASKFAAEMMESASAAPSIPFGKIAVGLLAYWVMAMALAS